jgi:hypothetical protein
VNRVRRTLSNRLEVLVLSQREAEVFYTSLPLIRISIREPGEDRPILPSLTGNIKDIYLEIEGSESNLSSKTLLINEGISIIKTIEENIKDKLLVMIHCRLGLSRSAGVALALAERYGNQSDVDFYKENYYPNKVVLGIMRDAISHFTTL